MRNFAKIIFIFFLTLPFSFSANCADFSENKIPNSIQNVLQKPVLIGSSELRFLGLKVYDIFLWSEDTTFSYEKIFAIQIKYNMNFSRDDLAKRSLVEIKRLHKLSAQQESAYPEQLKSIFSSVKKGDEKIAVFTPSKGVSMLYNDKFIGEISDLKLARFFVDIWLDEKGSYPKITKKLLGKN